jgi:2-methylcitrate dehydratase PrpD
MPAQHGVEAALMAVRGFTGVEDVFYGERKYFFTFSPKGNPNDLVKELGKNCEILRGGIKRWPAGGPIQGPLHVLRDLMCEHCGN